MAKWISCKICGKSVIHRIRRTWGVFGKHLSETIPSQAKRFNRLLEGVEVKAEEYNNAYKLPTDKPLSEDMTRTLEQSKDVGNRNPTITQ